MPVSVDRLYDLLPVIYRQRDAQQGYALQQLLRVITEQVQVIENDIAQLYENWFIETCEDWVVQYIGGLIGYKPVHEETEDSDLIDVGLGCVLAPRREVANTIGYRRSKGTLRLLQQLSTSVTGWPSRVVEYGGRVAASEPLDHLHPRRDHNIDLRDSRGLDLLNGPFDPISRGVDVRSADSPYSAGAYNLPNVAVFVWPLPLHSITHSPAYCMEEAGDHFYTFNTLGANVALHQLPVEDSKSSDIAGELNLPIPIRRREVADPKPGEGVEHLRVSEKYYGVGKSFAIWAGNWAGCDPSVPVPPQKIIPANLSGWKYRPREGQIAIDPELGRIAFPPSQLPEQGVQVSYHYIFSADIGGGEYDRAAILPPQCAVYCVGANSEFQTIRAAYAQWRKENRSNAAIEITDSGDYTEQLQIELGEKQSLVLRAANGTRPVIRVLDWEAGRPDALSISGAAGSAFTLDGLLITGRGVEVRGKIERLTIRHSTLIPGWSLNHDCRPRRPGEPSLALLDTSVAVVIERSVLGAIEVARQDMFLDPIRVSASDSILDANSSNGMALSARDSAVAPVVLKFERCTIFGKLQAHAIELAENTIFTGHLLVARRQQGCIRFCYVPAESRTPLRYHCQPDLVDQAARALAARDDLSPADAAAFREAERMRVAPQFAAEHYGEAGYGRLVRQVALEVKQGADDRSEMGVFHDLFEAQKEMNLEARLSEYTPAGIDVGIVFASQ